MGIYEREALEAHLESYNEGFADGYAKGMRDAERRPLKVMTELRRPRQLPATKRKLSAWNKFVKANSKKPRFIFRSGKLNLKKMGVAFRKTPAGRKKK